MANLRTVIKYNGTTLIDTNSALTKSLLTSGKLLNSNIEVIITSKLLPDEYQQVEYIKNTAEGTYINLNLFPSNSLGFKIQVYSENGDAGNPIGTWSTTGGYWGVYMFNSSKWEVYWYTNYGTYGSTSSGTLYTVYLNYNNSKYFNVDGTNYKALETLSISNTEPVYLFAGRAGAQPWIGRIYSCEITSGTTTVHNYVPCYCTTTVVAYQGSTQTTASSGTVGMYDTVENKFYINSGSGTFSKGPDVS